MRNEKLIEGAAESSGTKTKSYCRKSQSGKSTVETAESYCRNEEIANPAVEAGGTLLQEW